MQRLKINTITNTLKIQNVVYTIIIGLIHFIDIIQILNDYF